jgi:hypothetical protein
MIFEPLVRGAADDATHRIGLGRFHRASDRQRAWRGDPRTFGGGRRHDFRSAPSQKGDVDKRAGVGTCPRIEPARPHSTPPFDQRLSQRQP